MIDEIELDVDDRMQKAVEALKKDLAAIRTGRASSGLVDHVQVEYYGTVSPLNQIAGVTVPEARQIMINPWDKQALSAIEKAILKSNLGLTPSNDGKVIRLTIPQLTEERRRELVKMVGTRVETGRVEVRNIRRDGIEEMRSLQKNKQISEDDLKRGQELLQKLTDNYVAQIADIAKIKEAELMQV
ncbi:MAG: ribosome recycling factor [Chloroflexi bacterium]|jgi:ribosome recycling factor|nr:ribosome recycling factor [Chloroflexota bacterium]MBT7082214.1 ribosome recycling factor [Chloroflexota bacterium]MBT7289279.1 ribosome recycling factor [Chloroflexota bacterium]